jgi:ribosomal protein S6--L-glutamate ligase
MRNNHVRFIALGDRLRGVPEVMTLGVKPNFHDYSPHERALILQAPLILYPSLNYAQFFTTMGKRIFPSLETYLYADEKIKQTTLFSMLNIPHPRTKIYYHLHHALEKYLQLTRVAYIQEYLSHDKDLRVILINHEPILAYWRISPPGSFKTNIFQGGSFSFENIPSEAIEMAQDFSRKCKFNDVGLDFMQHSNKWYLIEANVKYGRKGLRMRGMDLKEIMRQKLLSGELF